MRIHPLLLLTLLICLPLAAQQNPYFVTYDDHMEEVANLEISSQTTFGVQKNNLPNSAGQLMEFEYGATGWWTTSLYLEGASQQGSTVFTGMRFENRFKPLKGQHWINPVLYMEFENINEATRIQKEIVGHAEGSDESLSALRGEKARELEAKLILSSSFRNWTISENFIAEKNLTENEGYEFGYALGVYRPLATIATGRECRLCRENFSAGLELYGGMGSSQQFGFKDTAHYIAPGLVWNVGNSAIKFSPAIGLTPGSNKMLLRVAYVYEISGFGHKLAHMFGGR